MKKDLFKNTEAPVLFGELSELSVMMKYQYGKWEEPILVGRQNILFGPNTSALHYGQAIFEGMRASLLPSGDVGVFRLTDHWRRFNLSAERMGMPQVPEDLFFHSFILLFHGNIRNMLNIDKTSTIYIRPSMVNSEETFMPSKADEFILSFTASSLVNNFGIYLPGFLEQELSRADRGGVGTAKTAGNYGRALLAEQKAKRNGFNSCLFAGETIQEFGTMSLFFVEDGILYTPSLECGLILDGITRRSVITLARKRGIKVLEKEIKTIDFISSLARGKITELFGCGTASILIPYNSIGIEKEREFLNYLIPQPTSSTVVSILYKDLLDAYRGVLFPEWNTVIPFIANTII